MRMRSLVSAFVKIAVPSGSGQSVGLNLAAIFCQDGERQKKAHGPGLREGDFQIDHGRQRMFDAELLQFLNGQSGIFGETVRNPGGGFDIISRRYAAGVEFKTEIGLSSEWLQEKTDATVFADVVVHLPRLARTN